MMNGQYAFTGIKDHFDLLDKDTTHYQNSNDICTPLDCVREMVDTVPQDFWDTKDIKVLDSCCGNGNFHAYIRTKTNLKNLYFNDINESRIKNVKDYFGSNIHLSTKDFLKFPDTKKFDMVVSNPPYALFTNGKRTAKNHNLSRAFISKALDITKKGGYLLFIVPNNWMSFSDRNTLPRELSQYQFLHINIGKAKKYFPAVGSSFTWFLLKKVPNKSACVIENSYVVNNKVKVDVKVGSSFIPLYYDTLTNSILDRVIYAKDPKYCIETSSNLHKYTKAAVFSTTKTEEHKYKVWHTPTQQIWSNTPHKYQSGYKVFISLTNQYKSFVDTGGMTQSIAFIRCKSLQEAQRIKKEIDSPVYRFIASITRYGNFNNVRVLQKLSRLQYVILNKRERSFIDGFNEKYYGRKEKEK